MNEPPASLRVFEPPNGLHDETAVSAGWEAFASWKQARRAFHDGHGWPSGFSEMLREEIGVRRALLVALLLPTD